MDLSNVPGFISAKLAALSDARATDAVRADQLTGEISSLRDRWAGRVQRTSDLHTDFAREIELRMAEQNAISQRLSTLTRIVTECRDWLASLPTSTILEQVAVELEGQTLQAVRAHIQRLEDSRKSLKQIPAPSGDIEQRVKSYIARLTQPVIKGVATGENLTVEWPAAPNMLAAVPHVDLFTLVAFLEPEKFSARLLAAIDKAAPPADRDQQIKNLESEIEKLQRAEKVLVVSSGAERISGRRPEVVLGCRVIVTTRSSKAA